MASTTSQPSSKTGEAPYELIYWPGLPGRGEHIRLLLEEAGISYNDSALSPSATEAVLSQISSSNLGSELNPPPFAPPILKHGDLTISQTPSILLYLSSLLPALPNPEQADTYKIHSLALTALDGLSNEVHDTHHPIAVSLYYEDQKPEALRRTKDFLSNRLPKYLSYFERVLSGPASKGGEYLYGGGITYADLVLFQCLDGISYAFPKKVKGIRGKGEYEKVWALYEMVKGRERVKRYLESERRQKYGMGIYRYYEELDAE